MQAGILRGSTTQKFLTLGLSFTDLIEWHSILTEVIVRSTINIMRHSNELVGKIKELRSKGSTYGEINKTLNTKLSKSTLHWICKKVSLPQKYLDKITKLNIKNLGIARATAKAVNKAKREELINKFTNVYLPVSLKINNANTAKIALAMLCLGEASKSKSKHAFSLGNSDSRVIIIFLTLLRRCFPQFDESKIRATVQCRADQNIEELTHYWQNITKISKSQFYKVLVDQRTVGKPTKRSDYMGVLNIYYLDKKVQLELETLADLVYNSLK
ncbi:hypothetical protein HZB69_03230 [Candidatus Amesbacteria bacterium]|nr:hypothetical protein [Candidatus Amesbacteria bacterium]